jgi:RecJ-like exonuclease
MDNEYEECGTCGGDGECPFCSPCDEPQEDCPYLCDDGVCSECHGAGEVEL